MVFVKEEIVRSYHKFPRTMRHSEASVKWYKDFKKNYLAKEHVCVIYSDFEVLQKYVHFNVFHLVFSDVFKQFVYYTSEVLPYEGLFSFLSSVFNTLKIKLTVVLCKDFKY